MVLSIYSYLQTVIATWTKCADMFIYAAFLIEENK